MIRYTGNPYVDAGVAVLELRLGKSCAEFTDGDLQVQAEQIKKEYRKKIWKSYLMLHLPNCAWTQSDLSSAKNQAYLGKVLESYGPQYQELDRKCAFCDRPAKLLADRRYVPLLTGETIMTSGPGGTAGLPICGYCVFAVHFYPFCTLKVEGRPLFWWAYQHEWTRRLNACFYDQVQRILAGSSEEFPKLRWPATQLLWAARRTLEQLDRFPPEMRPTLCDIVGIHATNYGTAPTFEEVHIPRGLLEFWSEAGALDLYRKIEAEAWESSEQRRTKKSKTRGKEEAAPEAASPIPELARRNRLYEHLGEAFRSGDYREKAKEVAVRFFLVRDGRSVAQDAVSLAEFFLEKVAGMEKERLNAIRDMADTVADHLVLAGGDRRLAWSLFRRKLRLGEFLQWLSQTQRKLSGAGHPFTWERVLLALGLASDDDRTSSDHWLVQELMLIRLYERLASSDILGEIPEPVDEPNLEPTQ